MKRVLFFLALLWIFTPESRAEPFRPFYRGVRAMAMGGAYVAVADDLETLYLNPAGLTNIKESSIHYAVLDLEASSDGIFNASDLLDVFTDFDVGSLNALMGMNSSAQAQFAPALLMPGFGVSVILDGQVAILAKNQALPNINVGYQTTTGIHAGLGFSINGQRSRPRRYETRPDLSLGVGAKVLWRRGGYQDMTPLELIQISQDSDDTSDMISKIAGSTWGFGVGVDVGVLATIPLAEEFELRLGSTFLDIGGTDFVNDADSIDGNIALGAAIRTSVGKADFTLSYQYDHLLQATDWRRKNHLGLEIDLPMIDIYGGLNHVYLTYGLAVDFQFLKLTALSYGEELGTFVKQDPDRRYMLRLDFSFSI